MASDTFSSLNANELLRGKAIYFFGDSNIRGFYKDLLWLLEKGNLVPLRKLHKRVAAVHPTDIRLHNSAVHTGRNYEEIRSYKGTCELQFHFMTRLYLPFFIETVKNFKSKPNVLLINSCVWDLSRWGADGVTKFKKNLSDTFEFLKSRLPTTRIIWMTAMPISFDSNGGFYTKRTEFLRNMLPWHVAFANQYAAKLASKFNIDVLDLHYHLRFLLHYQDRDGIHWLPEAIRLSTNTFLTHLALCWDHPLPGVNRLSNEFLCGSTIVCSKKQDKPTSKSTPSKIENDASSSRKRRRNSCSRRRYKKNEYNYLRSRYDRNDRNYSSSSYVATNNSGSNYDYYRDGRYNIYYNSSNEYSYYMGETYNHRDYCNDRYGDYKRFKRY